MKNKYILATIVAAIMVLSVVALIPSALANPKDENGDKILGHLAYKINFIGVPKDSKFSPGASAGNGIRIFIPLKTNHQKRNVCDLNSGPGEGWYKYGDLELDKGVKIKVSDGPFDVVDGNAVDDKYAEIKMPAKTYNVFVAAHGKPGGCLDLDAYYTKDNTNYYLIGTIDVDRSTGKPKYININHILYDGSTPYYAGAYGDYFWQIYNDNLRHMEVRFYEVPAV